MLSIEDLNRELGNIDIYLLDQILKGRFLKEMTILDAGCGEGRNLIYFLNQGHKVFGIDKDPSAIKMIRMISRGINKDYNPECFIQGDVSEMPYPAYRFDVVISSAVLHFAENHEQFETWFTEMHRVLKPGGLLFIRMTSDIGIETVSDLGNGVFELPDGSTRYLLTSNKINWIIDLFSYSFLEPLKSVLVDNQRTMSNLMLRKNPIQ